MYWTFFSLIVFEQNTYWISDDNEKYDDLRYKYDAIVKRTILILNTFNPII
jgi:hypothetical protein